MRVAVLGAGAWGSALAISFSSRHPVVLWTRRAEDCARIAATRESPYLPGQRLPDGVSVEADLSGAVSDCDLVIIATSTAGLRETATALGAARADAPLLWACKGFETATRELPHQVLAEALPHWKRVGALSGPSFALEVARGQPTALTIAATDAGFAGEAASALNSPRLRMYSSGDLVGVELGGALKNVIAIAAGISDGLSLGRNARAALVTRGLAEIVRLGVALGGQVETFMGLTGLGDLVLTCTGDLSRNRDVGTRLARGQGLQAILAELGHVAEGVHSASSARAIAREHGIEMPITEAVCAVLFEGIAPAEAVQRLLARDPRPE